MMKGKIRSQTVTFYSIIMTDGKTIAITKEKAKEWGGVGADIEGEIREEWKQDRYTNGEYSRSETKHLFFDIKE